MPWLLWRCMHYAIERAVDFSGSVCTEASVGSTYTLFTYQRGGAGGLLRLGHLRLVSTCVGLIAYWRLRLFCVLSEHGTRPDDSLHYALGTRSTCHVGRATCFIRHGVYTYKLQREW